MPAPRIVRMVVQPVRMMLGRSLAKRSRGAQLTRRIADMAELKMLDPNMSAGVAEPTASRATDARAKASG
jgi:hypothetical protein